MDIGGNMIGPLIANEFIGTEFNFVIAIFIGFAFGFILEQAGFGSSKKLAGQFYGYDFAVLRVFFTAAITAVIGIIFFDYFGLLNIKQIYINQFFVSATIIGGIIMGFGFIMGGFCPGTGFTGAVTGKIDAMIFIIGLFVGSLIFGESFSSIKEIYMDNPRGSALVFEDFGLSKNFFVFALILMALMAFGITYLIEKKSKRESPWNTTRGAAYGWPSIILIAIATIILFLPSPTSRESEVEAEEVFTSFIEDHAIMKAEEVAHYILYQEKHTYKIIDIRSYSAFVDFHLENSVNIPLEEILHTEWLEYIKNDLEGKDIILCSNGGIDAVKVWILLKRKGVENIYVLRKGLNNLFAKTFSWEYENGFSKEDKNAYRILQELRQYLSQAKEKTEEIKPLGIVNIEEVNISGGC